MIILLLLSEYFHLKFFEKKKEKNFHKISKGFLSLTNRDFKSVSIIRFCDVLTLFLDDRF
jgi:hypothetical protein